MQSLYFDAISEIDCIQAEYADFRQLSTQIEDELIAVVRRMEERLCKEQLRNVRQSEVLEKKIHELNSQIGVLKKGLAESEETSRKAKTDFQQVLSENKCLEYSYKQLQGYMHDLVENFVAKSGPHSKSKLEQDCMTSGRSALIEGIQLGNITSSRAEIDECKREINNIYEELGLHHMLIPRICSDIESYKSKSTPRDLLTSDRDSEDRHFKNQNYFNGFNMIQQGFNHDTGTKTSPEFGKPATQVRKEESSPRKGPNQDTPGFTIDFNLYRPKDHYEIKVQPFSNCQDSYVNRKANELINEFRSSLDKACRHESKSVDNVNGDLQIKKKINWIEKNLEVHRENCTSQEPKREYETNISTAQGSVTASIKEQSKKNGAQNSVKKAVENKENYQKMGKISQESSIGQEIDNSRMKFSSMASVRGILDPLLKPNSDLSKAHLGENSATSSVKFASLVSDVHIEDAMFSLGAKPL